MLSSDPSCTDHARSFDEWWSKTEAVEVVWCVLPSTSNGLRYSLYHCAVLE